MMLQTENALIDLAQKVDMFSHARANYKHNHIRMFASNPGFREPSIKAKNWKSTSLAMNLAIKLGTMSPLKWEGSDRGKLKREKRARYKKRVANNAANRLTNWQNSQWLKACTKARKDNQPVPVPEEFLKLVRTKH